MLFFCLQIDGFKKRRATMFDDLFNFSKKRNAKEATGFVVFYFLIFMGVTGFMTMLGF